MEILLKTWQKCRSGFWEHNLRKAYRFTRDYKGVRQPWKAPELTISWVRSSSPEGIFLGPGLCLLKALSGFVKSRPGFAWAPWWLLAELPDPFGSSRLRQGGNGAEGCSYRAERYPSLLLTASDSETGALGALFRCVQAVQGGWGERVSIGRRARRSRSAVGGGGKERRGVSALSICLLMGCRVWGPLAAASLAWMFESLSLLPCRWVQWLETVFKSVLSLPDWLFRVVVGFKVASPLYCAAPAAALAFLWLLCKQKRLRSSCDSVCTCACSVLCHGSFWSITQHGVCLPAGHSLPSAPLGLCGLHLISQLWAVSQLAGAKQLCYSGLRGRRQLRGRRHGGRFDPFQLYTTLHHPPGTMGNSQNS